MLKLNCKTFFNCETKKILLYGYRYDREYKYECKVNRIINELTLKGIVYYQYATHKKIIYILDSK